jgi:hypothetical protein
MKILYWIDDTHDAGKPPNGPAQKRLEKGLKVQLSIKSIQNRAQFDAFLPVMDESKTCGVIMDYQLTSVGENGQMAYGSTWAAEIRAAHPSIPVIGISHARSIDIPKLRLESFLAFFPRESLMGPEPPLDEISALLTGYSRVWLARSKQQDKSGVSLMAELACPPTGVAELFTAAIPTGLRGPWDLETPHVAGRWLWHDLQGRPGFLFDDLGLATYLGLNLAGFHRVSSKFKEARYRGAFSSDGRPRWWVNAIRSIVEHAFARQIVGPISGAREALLAASRVPRREFAALLSRAHGSKHSREVPDCVAYRDDQREEGDRVQALLKDTYVDDRDANPPFGFEARRVFGMRAANEE